MSNDELKGPINSIKCFKLLISHFLGSFKESLSTLSKGRVNCPTSHNKLWTNNCMGVIGRNGRRILAITTDVTSPKLKLAASFIYFIRFTKVRLPFCHSI